MSAPSQGGDRPDPGVADQWAAGGTAAVHRAAAQGDAPPPTPGGSLHPTVEPAALPEVTLPAGGPIGTAPAGPAPDGPREAAALDAAAGTPVHHLAGQLLTPAGAAGAAHRAEAALAHTSARTQVADIGTDAAARQQAVRASADQELLHEHAQWTTSRENIVQAHAADISSVAGGTKADISQTVAQADSQAAAQHTAEGGGSSSGGGLWDRVKRGASAVAGAVKGAVAAVGSTIAGILAAARSRVEGLLTRLASAVRQRVSAAVAALRAGAARVWGAMRAAVDRAQQAITRLARAAIDAARQLWAAVAARLKKSWERLVAAAKSAFAAAVDVARKIGAALAKVKEILKLLASPLVKFIIDAYGDVQKKIVDPLLAKAAPLVGKVPGMAKDMVHQQAAAPTAQPTVPLQRQPTTTAPAVDFSATVDRQMSADAAYFKENWLMTLGHVISQLIWPTGIFTEEFPGLWEELKGVWSPAPGLDRLDHLLGIARRLTNIVNGALAFIGIWAALIALAGGPVAEFVTVGTYYAVSLVMIQVDIGLALAQLLKYWYSGTRAGVTPDSVSQYARMYSATGIGAIVTAVLVILGMVASRYANRFKALLPKKPVEPVEKASVPPEEKPTVPDEKRPAEETTASLATWRVKLQLLQSRVTALRQRFTASGSTDPALNADITRLETTAQNMATRLQGAHGPEELTGFGRELRDLESGVRDAERKLDGLDVRPPSAVQAELARVLGMDPRTIAGFLDDAQCQRILDLINARGIVGDRRAGLRNFVQEYAARGRQAGKLMELLDTEWTELRQMLDDRARVSWEPNWRDHPHIENGNAGEGWQHIDERHISGTSAQGPGDLFAPGTTRADVQAAVEAVVANGTRRSPPGARMQTFEHRVTVHGRSDNVRVTVDASDGRVITAFPVRGG